MRILVLTDLAPHPAHTVQAANIVAHQLIMALAAQDGIEVACLRVHRGPPPPLTQDEADGEARMRAAGVTVATPLALPPQPPRRPALLRALSPIEADYIPEVAHRPLLDAAVADCGADIVLIPWSEWLTALAAALPVPKFAYYGNPPPKNRQAQRDFYAEAGGGPGLSMRLRQALYDRRFEAVHLAQMRGFDCLGNVAANDAEYYRANGHPNAFYIQNIWIDRFDGGWEARRTDGNGESVRIIGNIGNVGHTANMHGLRILGEALLPELRRAMNGQGYTVEVIGAGHHHPQLRQALEQPEVRFRGFVDDIDAEMLDAEVFLCLNNASSYNVGHTRYLHAWTLGCCVVAHRNAAQAMPEIVHGENALLGDSIAEIADLIAEAAGDAALRRKLGAGGYQTFQDHFTASHVADRITVACGAVLS